MVSDHDDLFIGGEFVRSDAGRSLPVVNPATEEQIGTIPDANAADVDRAVTAAGRAFASSGWPQMGLSERATYVRALADAIEKRTDDLGLTVTQQNGMPILASRGANGTLVAISYRYFASLADQLKIEEIRPDTLAAFGAPAEGEAHTIVRREPLGVVGVIAPWNGPQALLAWHLGPALIAGCTAVVKPAPETSLDAYILAEAITDAGLPPGVINIVIGGRETGELIVRHPGTAKIGFTGSSAAGKIIAAACGAMLKPATLELGGKSAAILLEDADLELFASFVPQVCSPNSGQVCYSCTRILAPRSRYSDVVEVVSDTMRAISLGDPMDPSSVFGPLVAARQRERVEGYIQLGRQEGAEVVTGGGRPTSLPRGFYVEPTVFKNVDNRMRIAQEEIFGPVLCVIPYDDEDDAVRIANDSSFGLGGTVFTADVEHGTDIARRVETGTIGVNYYGIAMNAPFGGYKNSGLGRELGPESISAFQQTKSIYRAGSADKVS